jgi:CheY-like chemotaxis protein
MSTKQVKILIADDDNDDRFFFAKALQEIPLNTRLTVVSNGEELMDYFSKNMDNLPDILFLDLSMPRKTGFECLIEIRANTQLDHIPVVMLSTSFMRGVDYEQNLVDTLIRMGAQDYVRKPNDFEGLKTVIYETLTKLVIKPA